MRTMLLGVLNLISGCMLFIVTLLFLLDLFLTGFRIIIGELRMD